MGWENGDTISVIPHKQTTKDNTSANPTMSAVNFDVKEIDGTYKQSAKFEGTISEDIDDVYWAVYTKNTTKDYKTTSSRTDNGRNTNPRYTHVNTTDNFSGQIPYAQTVLAGKEVDETAMYMTASTTVEDKKFLFKNLTALLKINIKSGGGTTGKKVKYVRFVANDTSAKLTGAFTATIGTDGVATVTPGTGNNSVLLQAEEGYALNGTYYISVLPATLNGGFKILLETECTNYSQEIYVRKSSGNITLKRNEIVDLGSYDATATGTENGAKRINESFISNVVDLDLPSATLWAAKNIAAGDKVFVDNVYDYGQYYCWGEDFGFDEKPTTNATNTRDSYKTTTINRVSYDTKLRYEWETYKWAPGNSYVSDFLVYTALGKYNPTDGKTELDPEDDIAQIKTGGQFCMPTGSQITELKENTSRNNRSPYATGSLSGYSYVSILNPNKKLWLPAAGIFYGALFDGGTFVFSSKTSHQSDVGTYAYYWSKSIYTGGNNYQQAYCLDTNTGGIFSQNNGRDRRYAARTIRPVLNK